jgi:lipopolysaccharide transport system ATP-binding protein
MRAAIRVENLSKQYRIGRGDKSAYKTLREALVDAVMWPYRALTGQTGPEAEPFWALKGVSFEVQPGEVVGIIGRNGAGKSTLLKVLSRITEPTTGRVEVRGRLGSLLEVGTGFHQELTGRENIYLNGSILGMTRREIDRKFDEIVAFSEIEQFLDTPVKRYSSGMYVRLAFAVAAYLDQDVMIVDEVLAVGDVAFQKKCLGKMKDISTSGRTILFVSHNMAAIQSLCTSGIFLNAGRVELIGTPEQVGRAYTKQVEDAESVVSLREHVGRVSRNGTIMTELQLTNTAAEPTSIISAGEALSIRVRFDTNNVPIRPVLGVVVRDQYGTALFGLNNRVVRSINLEDRVSAGWITCHYPSVPLQPGRFSLDLWLSDDSVDLDVVLEAGHFDVIAADYFGSGMLPHSNTGPLLVPASFHLNADSPAEGEVVA